MKPKTFIIIFLCQLLVMWLIHQAIQYDPYEIIQVNTPTESYLVSRKQISKHLLSRGITIRQERYTIEINGDYTLTKIKFTNNK